MPQNFFQEEGLGTEPSLPLPSLPHSPARSGWLSKQTDLPPPSVAGTLWLMSAPSFPSPSACHAEGSQMPGFGLGPPPNRPLPQLFQPCLWQAKRDPVLALVCVSTYMYGPATCACVYVCMLPQPCCRGAGGGLLGDPSLQLVDSFFFQMKTGPFAEHSNQLWNISAVPSWSKVNQGLIRMYKAEVSGDWPARLVLGCISLVPTPLFCSESSSELPASPSDA